MEILAIIVVVFVIMLIIGSADNARPVPTWSDAKLQRMRGKLLNAANAALNPQKRMEHMMKLEEVKVEIERRQLQAVNKLADAVAPVIKEVTAYMADQIIDTENKKIKRNLMKMVQTNQRVMQEENVTFEQAKAITRDRQESAAKRHIEKGMTPTQAQAASMKEIFDMDEL